MIFFEFGLAQWLAIGLGLVLVAIGAGYPLLRALLRRLRRSGPAARTRTVDGDAEFRRPGS